MIIESVRADGFGPLAGETLALAPGLTVVIGDNESGKSSWHGAIFAALCGRRRARGRPSAQEQRFIDTHQPWSGAPWSVTGVIALDDGRRIELCQDLSGRVDCRATDIALARDVSAQIMVDGSPDASAWLGLTRSTFRATACVGQAEVLGVLQEAEGLQHTLQRAAATAGTAGSAATAIELLETARRTHVGRDSAGSGRPLRRAREAVAAAEARVAAAAQAHEELAEQSVEVERLRQLALAAEGQAGAAAVEWEGMAQQLARREEGAASGSLAAAESRSGADPAGRVPSGGSRKRRAGAGAGVALALVLIAVAAATRSWILAALAVAAAGGGAWLRRGVPAAQAAMPARRSVELPNATGSGRATLDPELGELRLELAERRALAERARRRHHEAAVLAGRADAVLAERWRSMPPVADAQEALAAAQRELARVVELDQVLGLAVGFLARAQEQVHRSVAPELSELLQAWLPGLTAGRYLEARLDPATLEVQVREAGGRFRRAELLSHGTAEQVYLLLRVALADRLTAGYDTCPLLLDDVTVHADPVRAAGMLELLQELSRERQIILFSHQEQVRQWAAQQLDPHRDRLVELAAPAGAGGRAAAAGVDLRVAASWPRDPLETR